MLQVSCSKFSQISNSEMFLKIFQQLTKLPFAMQCLPFWATLYIACGLIPVYCRNRNMIASCTGAVFFDVLCQYCNTLHYNMQFSNNNKLVFHIAPAFNAGVGISSR